MGRPGFFSTTEDCSAPLTETLMGGNMVRVGFFFVTVPFIKVKSSSYLILPRPMNVTHETVTLAACSCFPPVYPDWRISEDSYEQIECECVCVYVRERAKDHQASLLSTFGIN